LKSKQTAEAGNKVQGKLKNLTEKSEAKKDCQPATKSVKPRLCPVVVLFSSENFCRSSNPLL